MPTHRTTIVRTALSISIGLAGLPLAAQTRPAPRPAGTPAPSAAAAPALILPNGARIASIGLATGGDTDGTGVSGGVEFMVRELAPRVGLGIGGNIGYLRESESFGGGLPGVGSASVTVSYIPITAIANAHFMPEGLPKADFYAGASLGVGRVSVSGEVNQIGVGRASETEAIFGAQLGGRYFFTPRLAGHAQLGLGDIPQLTAGVTLKF